MGHRLGIVIFAAAATAVGCVHQDDRPPLTGPSGLAQSVSVTAHPDVLYLGQNGPGQSATIVVKVLDESGGPETQRTDLRLDIAVEGNIQDCGVLTSHNIQTGSDGIATAIFTAPRGNPLPVECTGFSPGRTITIRAVPVGTNFQTAIPWTAEILMVSQGVILPPPNTPTPEFVFAPSSPAAGTQVVFDGSASCGGQLSGNTCPATSPAITSYSWNFGDGETDTGRVVSHDFAAAQTYGVTLTVTNSQGQSAPITKFVTVGPAAPSNPTAVFTAQNTPGSPPGHSMTFNATSSTAVAPATITNYFWNFGDGVTQNTTTAVTFRDYGLPAGRVLLVTLTVTDSLGRTASSSQVVTTP